MSTRQTQINIKTSIDKLNTSNLVKQLKQLDSEVNKSRASLYKSGVDIDTITSLYAGDKRQVRSNIKSYIEAYGKELNDGIQKQIEQARAKSDLAKISLVKSQETKLNALRQEPLSNKDMKSYEKSFSSTYKQNIEQENSSLQTQIQNIKSSGQEKLKNLNIDLKNLEVNQRLLNISQAQSKALVKKSEVDEKIAAIDVKSIPTRKAEQKRELEAFKALKKEKEQQLVLDKLKNESLVASNLTRSGLSGVIGTGAFASSAIAAMGIQSAFTYDQAKARVRNVSSSDTESNTVMTDLTKTAQMSGQSITDLASTYGKIRESLKSAGASTKETTDLVNTLAFSLRASGTTADQASAAIYQLSQALGTGVLRGDEFNSVAEGAPEFTRALARSLGVTSGELKKMADSGVLTSNVVMMVTSELENLTTAAKSIPLSPIQIFNQGIVSLGKSISESNLGSVLRASFKALEGNSFIGPATVDLLALSASVVAVTTVFKPLITAIKALKTVGGGLFSLFKGFTPLGKMVAIAGVAVGSMYAVSNMLRGSGGGAKKAESRVDSARSSLSKSEGSATVNYIDLELQREELKRALSSQLLYLNELSDDKETKEKIAKIKAEIKLLEKEAVTAGSVRLGQFTNIQTAFKLKEVEGLGGLKASKDFYAQATQFVNAIKFINGEVGKLGNVDTSISLVGFSKILDELQQSKSVDELAFSINILNDNLGKLAGTQSKMATEAISNMTVKLEEMLSKDISNSIVGASKALKDYSDIVNTLGKSRLNNSLLNIGVQSNLKSISNYKTGTDNTRDDEQFFREKLNIENKNLKDSLNLKLDVINKEREAKLKSIDLQTKKQVEANNTDLDKTKKLLQNKADIAKGNSTLYLGDAYNKQIDASSQVDVNRKLNQGENGLAEDTARTAINAIRMNAGKSVLLVEREANKERLDALLSYKSSVEDSINTLLQKQKDYATQVIEIERSIADKRVSFEKQSRNEQIKILTEQAQLRFLVEKDKVRTGLIKPNLNEDALKSQQGVVDKGLTDLRLATNDEERTKAIALIKEESEALKKLKLDSISSSSLSDKEKLKENILARQQYLDIISEVNKAELEVDNRKKASVTTASVNTNNILDTKLREQANVNAQVEQAGGSEFLISKQRVDNLKLGIDDANIEELKKRIQDNLLATPFKVRLSIGDEQVIANQNSNKMQEVTQPVNIYIGKEKVMEARATPLQVKQSLANVANSVGGR